MDCNMMGSIHGGYVEVLIEICSYLGVLLMDKKHRESI